MQISTKQIIHGLITVVFSAPFVLIPASTNVDSLENQPLNITLTERGQDLLDEAIEMFERKIDTATVGPSEKSVSFPTRSLDRSEYAVLANIAGDPDATWVLPSEAPLPKVVTEKDGSIRISATTTAPHKKSFRGQKTKTTNSRFEWFPPSCVMRYSPEVSSSQYGGWSDMCGQWGYVEVPDSRYDNYVFKLSSTCAPNSNWLIRECGVATKTSRNAGSNPSWTDWAPKGDTSGGCRSVNLGINVFGVSAGGEFQSCEENFITKSPVAPNFSSAWRFGGSTGGVSAHRTTALQIGVKWKAGAAADIAVEQWIRPVRPR